MFEDLLGLDKTKPRVTKLNIEAARILITELGSLIAERRKNVKQESRSYAALQKFDNIFDAFDKLQSKSGSTYQRKLVP